MNKILLILLSFIVVLCSQCSVPSDYFGYSDETLLKSLNVINQESPTVIDKTKHSAQITIPDSADLSQVQIESIVISSLAHADKKKGDCFDLSAGIDTLKIKAEGGVIEDWLVYADLNNTAAIKKIGFDIQASEPIITGQDISVVVMPDADMTKAKITELVLAPNATSTVKVGDIVDISQPYIITNSNKETDVSIDYQVVGVIDYSKLVNISLEGSSKDPVIYARANLNIIEYQFPESYAGYESGRGVNQGKRLQGIKIGEINLADDYAIANNSLKEGQDLDFSKGPISFQINEKGTVKNWEIRAYCQAQLPNNDFSEWRVEEAQGGLTLLFSNPYFYDVSSDMNGYPWGTTNRASNISGYASAQPLGEEVSDPADDAYQDKLKNIGAVPQKTGGGIHMYTHYPNNPFGQNVFSPGTIFAGTFEEDANKCSDQGMDPKNNPTELITPNVEFLDKPTGIKITYIYNPETIDFHTTSRPSNNSKANYGTIPGLDGTPDKALLGVALIHKEGDEEQRIATYFKLVDGTQGEEQVLEEKLVYGKYPSGQDPYLDFAAQPTNGKYVADPETAIPNEVYVIMKPSGRSVYPGLTAPVGVGNALGAEGSVLIVKSVEFTYE